MTKRVIQSSELKAGEFYGNVANKRAVSSSIITEIVHSKGRSLPEHSHELAFFSLLLDGSYSESYGRKSFSYKPFTILWHPSGISHKDEIGNRGGHFLSVEIQKRGLDTLKEVADVPADFHEQGTPLVWLACRLYHEFRNWQDCSELVAEGLTLEMLAHSARKDPAPRKKPPKWLKTVVERLNEEFPETPAMASLADEVGIHPVHIAAVFRKFRNETVGEYVQGRRVEYACRELKHKDKPLVEIAVDAGFSDQSHFTRVFRRFTGMTPGAFRDTL